MSYPMLLGTAEETCEATKFERAVLHEPWSKLLRRGIYTYIYIYIYIYNEYIYIMNIYMIEIYII